jgi:uncharacterized protein RhaS with RHS repeats
MQARYYDPVLGRFMANDPVGFSATNPMSFNRYSYANNSPHKFIDPNGQAAALVFVPEVIAACAGPQAVACGGAAIGVLASPGAQRIKGQVEMALVAHVLIAVARLSDLVSTANSSDNETASGSTETETESKGQGQPEVGGCPECGGDTSKKPGKIGEEHGLTSKEVRDRIHGAKSGQLSGNPDVEVCDDCGEIFPQTEKGKLGDSIGNIEDDY